MRSCRKSCLPALVPVVERAGRSGIVSFGLALAFGLPSTAGAWDWTKNEWGNVDRGVVERCFAQTPIGTKDAACVGEAAELCESTPPRHATTLDIMDCRMAEAVVWNDIVESQFAQQRKDLDITDESSVKPGRISEADALSAAHQAWKSFREAQCHLIYAINQGGSIRNVRSPICTLNMTADRALHMRDLFWMPQ